MQSYFWTTITCQHWLQFRGPDGGRYTHVWLYRFPSFAVDTFCHFGPRILNLQIKSPFLTRILSFLTILTMWMSEFSDKKSANNVGRLYSQFFQIQLSKKLFFISTWKFIVKRVKSAILQKRLIYNFFKFWKIMILLRTNFLLKSGEQRLQTTIGIHSWFVLNVIWFQERRQKMFTYFQIKSNLNATTTLGTQNNMSFRQVLFRGCFVL